MRAYIKSQKRLITKLLAWRQVTMLGQYLNGQSVLDVGCGAGVLEHLYPNVTSCDVDDQNIYGLKIAQCSAEQLPYADKAVDTVCLIGVIEHVGDKASAIREAFRVAQRQVIFVIPTGILWGLIRLVSKSEHIREHSEFNREKMGIADELGTRQFKWVIPGLFALLRYEVTK